MAAEPLLPVLRRAETVSSGGLMPARGPRLEVALSSPRSAPRMRSRESSCPSGKTSSQSSCSPERAQQAHHARTMHPMPPRVRFHVPGSCTVPICPPQRRGLDSTCSVELLDEPGAAPASQCLRPGWARTAADPARQRCLVPPASARESVPRPASKRQPSAPTGRQRSRPRWVLPSLKDDVPSGPEHVPHYRNRFERP